MNLNSSSSYPSFCIAGNCQLAPLNTWLKLNFPYCDITRLTPYHIIDNQSQIDRWIEDAMRADIVMMIPVKDSYRGFEISLNHIQSLLQDNSKFILYPSYHLEVFYPFFGYTKNGADETLRGAETLQLGHQYGDYHDFLAMALSTKSKAMQEKFYKLTRDIERDVLFRSTTIVNLGIESFNEFEKRYPDYIDLIKSDIRNGLAYTFNHPTGAILNEIYKKIWVKDLNLDIKKFIDFRQDPFRHMKLPIPSFVSRSILHYSDKTPWQTSTEINSSHIHESADNYIRNIKKCVSFYRKNPIIAEWNAERKKFDSAKNFLKELGI